jgi:cellulose 1,4-beta-cellobiosidase
VLVTVAAEPSQPEGAFLTNKDPVTIPEGGTAPLGVKLSAQPLSTTRVRISWISGDSDITVKGNASLTFDRTNWSTYQYITLAAAQDADSENGTATIRIHRIAGDPIPYKDVTAIEEDQPGNCATFQVGCRRPVT